LAARRIDPEQMKDLVAAQGSCLAARDAGSTDDYNQANEFFHRTIYKSSGNTVLEEIAGGLQQRLRPYRRLQLSMPGRMTRSHEEHELIIRCIADRDSAAAQTAMQKHIAIQGDFLNDFLVEMKRRSN